MSAIDSLLQEFEGRSWADIMDAQDPPTSYNSYNSNKSNISIPSPATDPKPPSPSRASKRTTLPRAPRRSLDKVPPPVGRVEEARHARDKFACEATHIPHKTLKYTAALIDLFRTRGLKKWKLLDQLYNYYDHCERFALTKHLGCWVLYENGASLGIFRTCKEAQQRMDDHCRKRNGFPFPIWAFYIRTNLEKATFEEYCETVGKDAFEERLIEELSGATVGSVGVVEVAKVAQVEAVITEVAEVEAVITEVAQVEAVITEVAQVEAVITEVAEVEAVITEVAQVEAVITEVAQVEAVITEVAQVVQEVAEVAQVVQEVAEVAEVAQEVAEVAEVVQEVAEQSQVVPDIQENKIDILGILYEHHVQLLELQDACNRMNHRIGAQMDMRHNQHNQHNQPVLPTRVRAFFRWLCVGSTERFKDTEPRD